MQKNDAAGRYVVTYVCRTAFKKAGGSPDVQGKCPVRQGAKRVRTHLVHREWLFTRPRLLEAGGFECIG